MKTNFYFAPFKRDFIGWLICFNGLFLTTAFGQNIPDANFANAIRATCPTCIDANNNLTASAATLTYLSVINKNISSLTGIGGFTNLTTLLCHENKLTSLPTLPSSLTFFDCHFNQLTSLPTLPSGLTSFDCHYNQLTSLPTLPNNLTYFDCSENTLTSLPTLPTGLTSLRCQQNRLTALPTLPNSITGLHCTSNQLRSLPTLPTALIGLYCGVNQLTSLPNLPNSLQEIFCYNNQLTNFQSFPPALTSLSCSGNLIQCLPRLPNNMTNLSFDSYIITCLPNIPTNVVLSNASGNRIDKTTFPICPGPTVITHPSVSNPICLGNAVTLTASAIGGTNISVQWQRVDANDVQFIDLTPLTPYASGFNATYTFTPTANNNGAKYRAVFSETCPAAATNFATLAVSSGRHIPNANFAAAIRINCPTCIDACDNLTAEAATLAQLRIENQNISNLTGLEGFTNLRVLWCDNNQLTTLPTLPSGLTDFACSGNLLTGLPTLPNTITRVFCSNNRLGVLPTLPSQLTHLVCDHNQLTNLPTLPTGMTHLGCFNNQIQNLPDLSSSLIQLVCNNNQLTSLPTLPRLMQFLNCSYNALTRLPVLPTSLTDFSCVSNQLTSMPDLPSTLQQLFCNQNNITCLPTLPTSLMNLVLDATKIPCLPNLPTNLRILDGVSPTDLRNSYAVCIPPSIITHPSAPSLACGSTTLTARASGGSNMTVKWQRAAQFAFEYLDITTPVNYPSGTAATLAIAPIAADQRAQYRAVFTSQCNEVATNAALLILPIGIHIPDANFAAAIRGECPTCIDACNNLTPIAEITTSLNVANRAIQNLSGIQGFTTLTQLICSNNQLTTLPTLPTTLTYLSCNNNLLTSLPTLPTTLQIMYIDHNQLTTLPTLPTGLTQLYTNHNQLTSLPSLPNTLTLLNCHFNQLPSLPTLSSALTLLQCNNNLITQLPTLPNGLTQLHGNNNQLQTLPVLPNSLTQLSCFANNIYCLGTLPTGLATLSLDASKITCLPNFPTNVVVYNQNTGANLRNTYALCTVPSNVTAPSVFNPVCIGNSITLTASIMTNSSATVKWQRQRTTDVSYVDISMASPYTSGTGATINVLVTANDNGAKYQAVFANCVATTVTASATFQFSTGIAVPDANFVTAIRNQCVDCLDKCGNVTSAAASLTTLNVSNLNINSIAGIEGFTGLQNLTLDYNPLSSLPNNLPNSLTTLSCRYLTINSLPANLPTNLVHLYCGNTFINVLPATLPTNLRTLDCSNAYLTALPNTLPSGLLTLNCKNNQLTALPTDMPFTLTDMNCDNNALTNLPVFSSALRFLYCRNNQITNLLSVPFSSLSSNLRYLYCSNNRLTNLPDNLPGNILEIECYDNNIYCLPTLPNSLTNIKLDKLKITCLPNTIAGLVIQNRDIAGDISNTYALCTAPSIVTHPSVSGSPQTGQRVTFTARATNNSVTTVKWQRKAATAASFSDIAGTETPYTTNTNTTYTTPNLTNADVNASYRAVFTTQCSGNTPTNAAVLNGVALPIELLSFSGKTTEGGNLLTWTTANEVNNKGFYVETRFIASNPNPTQSTSSLLPTDEWKILGFVAATDATKDAINRVSTYKFTDKQPLPTSYYRLRQMDNDGKETLSKVIAISHKAHTALKVYPSVSTGILTIETTEIGDYEVFNLLGQQVFRNKLAQHIDVSALPQGTYLLKVGKEQTKFVKQ